MVLLRTRAGRIGRLGLIAFLALAAPAAAQNKLALVGGMLLDGYEVPPVHHAAVVIEGNRIVAVGPAAQIQIPPDAEVIDTSGRVMMPGMIDLHAHLAVLGHGSYGRWFSWLEEEGNSHPAGDGNLGEAAPARRSHHRRGSCGAA